MLYPGRFILIESVFVEYWIMVLECHNFLWVYAIWNSKLDFKRCNFEIAGKNAQKWKFWCTKRFEKKPPFKKFVSNVRIWKLVCVSRWGDMRFAKFLFFNWEQGKLNAKILKKSYQSLAFFLETYRQQSFEYFTRLFLKKRSSSSSKLSGKEVGKHEEIFQLHCFIGNLIHSTRFHPTEGAVRGHSGRRGLQNPFGHTLRLIQLVTFWYLFEK